MSQRRLGLFLLAGSLLLVTPLMVSFSRGMEKSIFSAMATLADVKETLESKRDLLTDLYADSQQVDGPDRDAKVQLAKKHLDYARDVYRLAQNFLKASSARHPKYETFWTRYEQQLGEVWGEIDQISTRLDGADDGDFPAEVPDEEAAQAPPMAAAPRAEQGSDAEAPGKEELLDRYREAYSRYAQGDPDGLAAARRSFETILEHQPSFHLARYWLAKTHLRLGQLAAARSQADALLADQPNLQIARELVQEVARREDGPAKAAPIQVAKAQAPVTSAPTKAAPAAPSPARTPPAPQAPTSPRVADARAVSATQAPRPVRSTTGSVGAAAMAARALPPAPRRTPPPAPIRTASRAPIPAPPANLQSAPLPPALVGLAQGRTQGARPLAVMVENSRHARPQSGLMLADYVYEMPVEGGITRFMTVFTNPTREVEELGPVRSARHYFVQQVPGIDAIYAHCGGSTQGYAALKSLGVDHIDEIRTGWGFWRDKQRKAPHNLYTKLENLVTSAKKRSLRTDATKTDPLFPVASVPVRAPVKEFQDITLPYYHRYKVEYTYDPVTNVYARSINGEPHDDALIGRQIAVENVVVVKTEMRKIDTYGRLDLELLGRGEAMVFRGGEKVQAHWLRGKTGDRLTLRDARGAPVQLNPGRTWVHMIQPNRKLTVARRPLPPAALAWLEKARKAEPIQVGAASTPAEDQPLRLGKALSAETKADVQLARASTPAKAAAPRAPVEAPPALAPAAPAPVAAKVRTAAAAPAVAPARPVSSGGLAAEVRSAPSVASTRGRGVAGVVAPAPRFAHLAPRPPASAQAARQAPSARAGDVLPGAAGVTVGSAGPPALAPAAPVARAARPGSETASRVWKDGGAAEYDLADFSLDAF